MYPSIGHISSIGSRAEASAAILSNWQALRAQLLLQWKTLSASEVDAVGPNRNRLARLIGRKYGIAVAMVENYLRNFERTMPLIGHT